MQINAGALLALAQGGDAADEDKGGRLIALSSLESTRVIYNVVGVSKSALEGIARNLAFEEDIAKVVLFLVSPLADMIRGQTIVVDGGYSIVA